VQLKQIIDLAGYDGIAGVYLLDLQNSNELHFIYQQGEDLLLQPDVAFSASSTIKIPIMISTFRHIDNSNPPAEAINLLEGMIEESGNDPADWLMEQYIDPIRGPLLVTEDLRKLGIENTFIAGHFRLGSPLLVRYETPSNSRTDIDTYLDPYNQTTLSDLGMILSDLYQCEQFGGGTFVAVFPEEITQNECRQMVTMLTLNNTPFLIEAGAPEGTRIAHKHGWITDLTGAIRTIGDAGIVYTPSGDYVLVFFFYHPVQLVWDPVSGLIGELSKAIYNYYNLPSQ
jgi:beta-lactamase class A